MLNLELKRTYENSTDLRKVRNMVAMNNISIKKRTGINEPLDLEKMHKVVFHACSNLTNVSASQVEINSHLSFFNGMTTVEIQETLIKSAADLISESTPNYQYVGGRLISYHLRKMVYGEFEPWHLHKLVKKNVEEGYYDPELLNTYTEDEWNKLNGLLSTHVIII